jgi:hypothetical protein
MDGVVHHLFDVCDPSESFSLSDYCALAHKAIKDVYERGKIPILAGGTGLYIDTVCDNIMLSDAEGNSDVRDALQKELSEKGAEYLYNKLCEIDIESAKKLHVNDTKRVIRALEIFYLSGKTKTEADKISKKNNCDEAIMYRSESFVTEGSHSNVSILKDGKLITAPNSKYILPGVTRAHIIEIANQNSIPVEERRYSIKELLSADEIIISSSSKMVRGVSQIDNTPVGGKDENLLSLFRDNIYNNYINATT